MKPFSEMICVPYETLARATSAKIWQACSTRRLFELLWAMSTSLEAHCSTQSQRSESAPLNCMETTKKTDLRPHMVRARLDSLSRMRVLVASHIII